MLIQKTARIYPVVEKYFQDCNSFKLELSNPYM
jgi:hypothetical protein